MSGRRYAAGPAFVSGPREWRKYSELTQNESGLSFGCAARFGWECVAFKGKVNINPSVNEPTTRIKDSAILIRAV